MPARPDEIRFAMHDGIAAVIGLCSRCMTVNRRLPHGTAQKRLNAAARLAATDTSGRYLTARFPDLQAAELAAHMLGSREHAVDAAQALNWL